MESKRQDHTINSSVFRFLKPDLKPCHNHNKWAIDEIPSSLTGIYLTECRQLSCRSYNHTGTKWEHDNPGVTLKSIYLHMSGASKLQLEVAASWLHPANKSLFDNDINNDFKVIWGRMETSRENSDFCNKLLSQSVTPWSRHPYMWAAVIGILKETEDKLDRKLSLML